MTFRFLKCFVFTFVYHGVILLVICSHVSSDLLNLNEGSNCMRKGVPGKCVSIYRCLGSLIDLRENDYAPICSFQGKDPIICCTDCDLVNDTRKIVENPILGILFKTGQKANDKCIDFMDRLDYNCKEYLFWGGLDRAHLPGETCFRILTKPDAPVASYANDASRGVFQHMALLGYGDSTANTDWLCGGSVISERFILTAGHCLSSPNLGPVKFAALGILKRSDPLELWEIYNVKRRIPHPEYKSPSQYNDIALLETDTEISFKNRVKPACLDISEEQQNTLEATGWGAVSYKSHLADNLQVVYVSRFEKNECLQIYPRHRHLKNGYNHTTQMCYGDKEVPKNTCEGDSGGPLQYQGRKRCVFMVAGVTSFGGPCGISAGSGVYTRVKHFVPWIESVVWP